MSRRNRRSNTQAAASPRTPHLVPALILLAAGLGAYAAVALNAIVNGRLDFEEIGFLIKGWWYITGALQPFGSGDTATALPGYAYALGAAQKMFGLSITTARSAMVGLGLINGVLLFLLCRKLTANTLASAAAVFVFLGSPATSYSFSTATPAAFVAFLHLLGLWLVLLSLGRSKPLFTVLMGAVLAAIALTSADMWLPAVFLGIVYIGGVGRARFAHTAILIVTVAALIAAAVYALPDAFTTYLLSQPLPLLALNALGMTPLGAPALPTFGLVRMVEDAINGVLLPYSGTIVLCIVLFVLTLKGPRLLWAIPFYLAASLISLVVFRAASCDTCVIISANQVMAAGGVAAAVALAFLARWRRQKQGTGTPFIIGGATLALALNCFGPVAATRPELFFFPAEMVKQARPAAELQDVTALMRVIGENIPGTERVLMLHKVPGVPYAMHMAGRRFAAVSINPLASLKPLPANATGPQREALLALTERTGGWSGETLRRWVEREYDVIILQDGLLALDMTTRENLSTAFAEAAVTDFRGAKLTIYRRKP
ncbi:MAG: hypothetical protein JNK21_14855 [Rhodospirillaceae bacterium]|nr:hypothetical protein [Rhodospirillaceae bacterium]